MRAGRRVSLLFCLLGAAHFARAGALSAQAGAQSSAPIIDSIVVTTRNVFDSAEVFGNPAFGAANAIHVKTHAGVVRRELLFKVGEPLDMARLLETARNLRRMGLFRRVAIDTGRVAGRFVVFVVTGDGWSTSLELNAKSTGGVFTWSTALTELNLLGTGNQASIGYRKDVDRNAIQGLAAVPRMFGTRVQGSGSYSAYSDGYETTELLGVPFRANSDRQSYAWSGDLARRLVYQFRDGNRTPTATYQRRTFRTAASATVAPHADPQGYVRIGLWGMVKNEEYLLARDSLSAVPDTVSGAVAAYLAWQRADFTVVSHYNGFARDEDVDLSERVQVVGWLAPAAFGYQRTGVGPAVDAGAGFALGSSFFKVAAHANGLFTSAGLDSGTAYVVSTAAARVISRQATILHVEAGSRHSPAPGQEWDLGHGVGPRSFGPHAFTGTRMVWGTLEHRAFLIDELFGVVGVGFAAFVDYGGAWYADEPARKGGNVGFGLRLGATRATGNNVGRFDLAYRFGDGITGSRWVFSFGRSFAY